MRAVVCGCLAHILTTLGYSSATVSHYQWLLHLYDEAYFLQAYYVNVKTSLLISRRAKWPMAKKRTTNADMSAAGLFVHIPPAFTTSSSATSLH